MTVVKVVELIGTSKKSWQEAIEEALRRASKTIRNINGVDVLSMKGVVKNGKIIEYRANIKVTFLVEE